MVNDKLAKVRAEIERQIAELTPTKEKIGIVGGMAVKRHLASILSFIDSLQEEPKSKCKGCNNVKGCITCVDGSEWVHIEECNITGITSKHATGKLKELVDNISEEGLKEARKQLEELTKGCIYSKDNYTDEDRKVLCDGCEELCIYNQKDAAESLGISQEEYEEIIDKCLFDDEPEIVDLGDMPFGARNSKLEEAIYYIPEGYHAIIDGDKVIIKKL